MRGADLSPSGHNRECLGPPGAPGPLGQVARLAPGGAHGAQPHPEETRQYSGQDPGGTSSHARLGGRCRSRGPGASVHQGGLSARGQAGVWSTAGEGPELWRSPPPSPVGTALTLAGLGHAERRRRGRGRGGRPQTSVECEPNCKIQRQEPPDCRWGPGGHCAPRPRSPGLWGRASAGQQDRLKSPVAGAGYSSGQAGPESRQAGPRGLRPRSSRAAGRPAPATSLPSPEL